jgi:iron-sulfur cluster assembly accessory protein
MTEQVKVNVEITPTAEKFIRRMMRFAKGPGSTFRLNVTPGGCSGYAVAFDVLDAPGEGELVWEQSGMRLCSDQKSCALLEGAVLNFVETLAQTGFVVTTPGKAAECCSSTSAPSSQFVSVSMLAAK